MTSMGIVIVTYNRLECLKKNIDCLSRLDIPRDINLNIYVIDNASTDGTREWLDKKKNDFNVIHMNENMGGSGGFSKGIDIASKENDYVWGMDDDAFPRKESLIELYDVIRNYGENACYWSNCDKDVDFNNNVKKVDTWMFVGFCVPSKIVKNVGSSRDDFFIYFDDDEYAKRIIKSGFSIYKVKDSIIDHSDRVTQLDKGSFWGKEIFIPKLNEWRIYYYTRNRIIRYRRFSLEFWRYIMIKQPWLLFKTWIINKKLFYYACLGYFDGIKGKSGKVLNPKDF